jgi:hypothetical protein
MVRSEIDDKLAQDLVIGVCGTSPHVWMVTTHRTLFLFRFLVARGRARKPFKAEGFRRTPVLWKDVSSRTSHCIGHYDEGLMNRYFFLGIGERSRTCRSQVST